MANTINTNLQNNIISQSALEEFTSIMAPLQAFSTSFNDEAGERGKTINITTLDNTTSATDFTGTYSSQDTTYGTTTITLTGHKFVTWHVTDTEVSQSSAVELNRFGYQKGGDLGKAVYQDILSAVTATNFGTAGFTGAASTFDSADVADLRSDAITANLPVNQCSLVLSNEYYTSLLKDANLNPAQTYGDAQVIRDGAIPSLFGIGSLYESNSIPANGENLVGFLAHPSAMAVAMRYLQPINTKEYISARRLVDDQTGMVLGYREYYEPSTGKQTAVLEAVYGFTAALDGSLIRIVSA